ncbi:MAG: hypothetical protein Q8R44_04355 [Novosphingobium sp.]|nr:hypothetical protein [Novosphingobium sp.]
MTTIRKLATLAIATGTLTISAPASAQLEVWKDYTPQETVVELTYVKVDEGQLNTYLQGLKQTWVRANEVSKSLGQISDYGIYTVPYGNNEVNLVLRVNYPSMASLTADKARYDAFLNAWGKQNLDNSNKTVRELYNNIRKIKGTYVLRELKMNP